MAWNIPGKNNPGDRSGKNGGNPWKPRGGGSGGGGMDDILDRLRSIFGDGGGPLRWLGLAFALWLVFNCFVLVTEQQRGVVLRFGQFARVLQPGPHLKLPWPIERVTKVAATQIKTFTDNVPVLTSDENIVQVEMNVQYRVIDAQKYLFGTRDADKVLQQALLSIVREQVGRASLNTVLNARDDLATVASVQLQKSLDAYNTGLVITELTLPNASPPEEVKPAFDDVNSAQQDKDRLTSEAQAYAAKVVPEARGDAARVRAAAEGYKTASVARAIGDAERFTLLQQQYAAAPEVTRKRLWLETVQQVLAGNRKVVGGDGRQLIYVPMTGQGGSAIAQPPLAPEMIAPTVNATTIPMESRPERGKRPTGREEATQ